LRVRLRTASPASRYGRYVMRELFPRSILLEVSGDQLYAVFDELVMPDGERTVAGLALFDALARPEEFHYLKK
jgi:hypothetical protein